MCVDRNGVICCGGEPTENDLLEIAKFRQYLTISAEAQDEFGLGRRKASEYAATEVYGDKYAEGAAAAIEKGEQG